MARDLNNNGAKNDGASRRSFDKSVIGNIRREYNLRLREGQIRCSHCDSRGPVLEVVRESKENIKNKDSYSDKSCICTDCKDIFDMTPFSRATINDAFYVLYSMANQIKIFDKMNDEDYEKIVTVLETLDELNGSFAEYYLNMIKKLGKGGNNKNQNKQNNSKGRIGITAKQYSR